MSFLLDTDICSAYLKNDRTVAGKVLLHFGSLHVTVVTVGEVLTWALRATAPPAPATRRAGFLEGHGRAGCHTGRGREVR